MMKKAILVTLTMLLIVSLSACSYGNETDNENLLGTWELDSVSVDGIAVDLTVDSSAMIPYDYTFTFLDGGKAVADALGVSYTTSYEVTDGIITFSDVALSPLRLVINGDTLEMKNDITRATLTFTKQSEE